MKAIISFLSFVIQFLPNWLFGVRVEGEKIPDPTFTIIEEVDRPEFSDWCLEVGASKRWKDQEPVWRAKWMMNQWNTDWRGVAK